MLRKLRVEIAECYRRVAGCREKAAAADDAQLKEFYADMEERWLKLARSYELTDRVQDFSDAVRRRPKQWD